MLADFCKDGFRREQTSSAAESELYLGCLEAFVQSLLSLIKMSELLLQQILINSTNGLILKYAVSLCLC